jgi:large subunit ribosomal protein L14
MINVSAVVLTQDNSGARKVKVIKIYKKPGRGRAFIGDLIQVIVVRLRNRGLIRVKKSELHLALVTRIATPIFRFKSGYFFKFDVSCVVLLTKKKTPIGTRLFGPVSKELRTKNYLKILSLASTTI